MKRDRRYGSGDCRTWQAVSVSQARNWWQLKLFFENLRIVKVWMIFIFISSCLVSALLVLQMKCWTIFGENILWTNLTWLGTVAVGHLGQSHQCSREVTCSVHRDLGEVCHIVTGRTQEQPQNYRWNAKSKFTFVTSSARASPKQHPDRGTQEGTKALWNLVHARGWPTLLFSPVF